MEHFGEKVEEEVEEVQQEAAEEAEEAQLENGHSHEAEETQQANGFDRDGQDDGAGIINHFLARQATDVIASTLGETKQDLSASAVLARLSADLCEMDPKERTRVVRCLAILYG